MRPQTLIHWRTLCRNTLTHRNSLASSLFLQQLIHAFSPLFHELHSFSLTHSLIHSHTCSSSHTYTHAAAVVVSERRFCSQYNIRARKQPNPRSQTHEMTTAAAFPSTFTHTHTLLNIHIRTTHQQQATSNKKTKQAKTHHMCARAKPILEHFVTSHTLSVTDTRTHTHIRVL